MSIERTYLDTEKFSFSEFLAPGLICMAIMQNAFANTSSSILISKVQGNIVDVLMPPMAEYELTFSYMLGGITRGLLVGFLSVYLYSWLLILKFLIFLLFYILLSFHQVYCQCLEFYVEFGQKSLTIWPQSPISLLFR